MSVKEQILEAIQRLPDEIEYRAVVDEVALLAAVQEAELDIKLGQVTHLGGVVTLIPLKTGF